MNRHAIGSAAACAALFCACAPAWGQINKCVDARGRVSYQEQPCPGAKIERFPAGAPAQPPATPDQPAKDSDMRARVDAAPRIDFRSQCPHAFADIEKARANLPNLKPGEQERLREVLEKEEAMWRERCR